MQKQVLFAVVCITSLLCFCAAASAARFRVGEALDLNAILPTETLPVGQGSSTTKVYRLTLLSSGAQEENTTSPTTGEDPSANAKKFVSYAQPASSTNDDRASLYFCNIATGESIGPEALYVPNSALYTGLLESSLLLDHSRVNSVLLSPDMATDLTERGLEAADYIIPGYIPSPASHSTYLGRAEETPAMDQYSLGNAVVLGVCGSTGLSLRPKNPMVTPRPCGEPLPGLDIPIVTTVFSVDLNVIETTPPTATNIGADHQATVTMMSGAAVSVEIDPFSPWCTGTTNRGYETHTSTTLNNAQVTLKEKGPVVARAMTPSIAVPLTFHDPWGNLATVEGTAEDVVLGNVAILNPAAKTINTSFIPFSIVKRKWNSAASGAKSTLQKASATEIAVHGGDWCVSVDPLLVQGYATKTQQHTNISAISMPAIHTVVMSSSSYSSAAMLLQRRRAIEGSNALSGYGASDMSIENQVNFVPPMAYELSVDFPSMSLGGSSRRCAKMQLAPGPPRAMMMEVHPATVPYDTTSFENERHLTVPSGVDIEVAVHILDDVGNPMVEQVPFCDTNIVDPRTAKKLPTTTEKQTSSETTSSSSEKHRPVMSRSCLECTLNGSVTSDAMHYKGAEGSETIRAVINGESVSSGSNLTLSCRLHNRHKTHRNISYQTRMFVTPHGQFDCYDGNAAITSYLTQESRDSIQSAFFSSSNSEVPLAQASFIVKGNPAYRNPDPDLVDLLQWVLVPKSGYVAIPLGLLSAMAFGAHYTKVSHVDLELTKPLCSTISRDTFQNAIARWLYEVGQNSSRYYAHLDMSSPPSTKSTIALSVCHGSNIEALEFVQLTCCDRYGVCRESTTETPLAYVLLVGGILVGLLVGLSTFLYLRSTLQATPVHLQKRHNMDNAAKFRVALVHFLAPFVLIAHVYFIFDLSGNTAATSLFVLDVGLPVIWAIAVFTRFMFPLHVFTTPFYFGAGTVIMSYSQFLLTNAVIWTISSLHLNIRLIPFSCASVLIVLQVFFTIRNASDELGPSFLKTGATAHSMVPIDAVMSLELFAITVMSFMFAVTWVEDISPFAAVVAAFVVLAYGSAFNYSLSAQFQEAFKKHFGADSDGNSALAKLLNTAANGQQQEEGFDDEDKGDGNDGDGGTVLKREPTSTSNAFTTLSNFAPLMGKASNVDEGDVDFSDNEDVDYAKLAEEEDYDENGNLIRRKGVPVPRQNAGGSGAGGSRNGALSPVNLLAAKNANTNSNNLGDEEMRSMGSSSNNLQSRRRSNVNDLVRNAARQLATNNNGMRSTATSRRPSLSSSSSTPPPSPTVPSSKIHPQQGDAYRPVEANTVQKKPLQPQKSPNKNHRTASANSAAAAAKIDPPRRAAASAPPLAPMPQQSSAKAPVMDEESETAALIANLDKAELI